MRWLVNLLLIALLAGSLTGCSNVSLSDLSTGAGAVVGGTLGAVTGNPAIVAVTSTGGAAVGSALVGETNAADVCIENPEACVAAETGETVRDIAHWLIGGAILLIIVGWLIPGPNSLFRKSPKNRP